MTSAIGTSFNPIELPTRARTTGGERSDFAQLLGGTADAASASPRPAPALSQAGGPREETETAASDPLGDLLAQLHEKLSTLAKGLDEDMPPANEDIKDLENLLAAIEGLMAANTPLPAASLETLVAAAQALGGAQSENPLEALSALAAKLAAQTRGEDPELTAKLTDFTKAIDSEAAMLQAARAGQKSDDTAKVRHIESQAQLNPATVLGDEPDSAKPAAEITKPAESARTLVKPEPASTPAPAAAPAQSAPAAAAPEAETPDTLVLQNAQPQQPSGTTATALRPEAAAYQRPDAQINTPHIAAEIARHVQNGISRFEIRLNPAEMGRIDVRMEMDGAGNVIARLAVERSETLDLLQRDQRTLERALAEAGLDKGKTELEFSLRQDGGGSSDENGEPHWRKSALAISDADAQPAGALAQTGAYMRGYARLDAVNLWV